MFQPARSQSERAAEKPGMKPGMKLVAACLLAPALQVAAQPGDVPVEWSLSPDAHGVTVVSLKPLARCCTGSRGSQPRRTLRAPARRRLTLAGGAL